MNFAKSYLMERFAGNEAVLKRLDALKKDTVCVKFMTPEAAKTDEQNRLFHALLNVFWDSGCSSFVDIDDMRLYYKRTAGLVQKNKYGFLVEASWANAKKEQARRAIDTLLHDMDFSGVIGSSMGKKYQEILNHIKKDNPIF